MFVFHIFAALAEFIRTIIAANTNEGLAAARARGQQLSRPPAMTPEKVAYALQLLGEPDRTMTSIAKLLSVSHSTGRGDTARAGRASSRRPLGQRGRRAQ